MEFSVVPARMHHIDSMYDRVRASDMRERQASSGDGMKFALVRAIERDGIHFTWLVDGLPGAMFGVAAVDKAWECGSPWLIGTSLIETYGTEVLRQTRRFTSLFRKQFKMLANYVMADNEVAIKWLAASGYTFDAPIALGFNGELFSRFWWSKDNV